MYVRGRKNARREATVTTTMNFYGGENGFQVFMGMVDGNKSRGSNAFLFKKELDPRRDSCLAYPVLRDLPNRIYPNILFSVSLSLYIYIKISLSVYDNLFTSSKKGPNIERPQHQLPRSPTKSRNNKSGRGVTLFMGLLYGDDALRGWPNMSQSVAAISPLRAIVEGTRGWIRDF